MTAEWTGKVYMNERNTDGVCGQDQTDFTSNEKITLQDGNGINYIDNLRSIS